MRYDRVTLKEEAVRAKQVTAAALWSCLKHIRAPFYPPYPTPPLNPPLPVKTLKPSAEAPQSCQIEKLIAIVVTVNGVKRVEGTQDGGRVLGHTHKLHACGHTYTHLLPLISTLRARVSYYGSEVTE